jgi:uncharacterized protein (TIGR03067 family)
MPVKALVSAIWWKKERDKAEAKLAQWKKERDEAVAERTRWKKERDEAVAERARTTDEIARLQREIRDLKDANVVSADAKSPAAPVQNSGEPAPAPFQKEYDALQGTWVLVWEEGTSNIGSLMGLRLIIKGKRITVDLPATGNPIESTYKVDPGQHPKAIDLISDRGELDSLWIYELEGQVLRTCGLPASLQLRPTEFKATAGGQALLLVFRRVNDKELGVLKKAEELQDLREQLSKIQTELEGERRFLQDGIPILSGWNYTPQQVKLNRMDCSNRIAWLEEAEAQIKQLLTKASDLGPKAPKPTPEAPKRGLPPLSPEGYASGLLRVAKGDIDRARKKYEEIVEKFPKTKAAEAARALLKKLGE